MRRLRLASAAALVAAALVARPAVAQSDADVALITRSTPYDAVQPGTKVRLLLTDSSIFLGRARPVGWPGIVEGRLLVIGAADARVRFARGHTFEIPSSAVRRLEARVGSGACGATRTRRVFCRAGVMAVGVGVGALMGNMVGGQVGSVDFSREGDSNGTWILAGALTGASVSALMVPRVGGDDWAVVRDWARSPDP